MHFPLENARRIVIKLGTRILTSANGVTELDSARIRSICRQVSFLRERGLEVLLVSSGAVGLGMGELAMTRRPTDLATQQACAALGQSLLMDIWRKGFLPYGIKTAQLLLTHEDVSHRKRHVAVMNTLERLLALGVVPIINENDSVSVDELKFGDNDFLAALTAIQTKADLLVILSTIPGLLDRSGSGEVVPFVPAITPEIEAMAGGPEDPGSMGGMRSKITSASKATQSGCGVFIGSGNNPEILHELFAGKAQGTFFLPEDKTLTSRKRWIAFFSKPQGSVKVDAGARVALLQKGRSLLAKGITGVDGIFDSGAVIDVQDADGCTFARGISQFTSTEIERIKQLDSAAIEKLYPERSHFEVLHRDTLVMIST